MTTTSHPAVVNSSYTFSYILSTTAICLFFGHFSFKGIDINFYALLSFSLLLYFMRDFIKQLYHPGQTVIVFAAMFIIIPFLMDTLLNFPYAYLGTIVIIWTYVISKFLDLIYNKLNSNNVLLNKFLEIDRKIDERMVKLSNKYIYFNEYNGFIVGLIIAFIYFITNYVLFHR